MLAAWRRADPWLRAALAAWILVTLAVCARSVIQPHRSNAAAKWQAAGAAWFDGEPLYHSDDAALDGYRPSPLAACLFVPLAPLPLPVAGVLLRLLIAAFFVVSALLWMRRGLPTPFTPAQSGIALLLMLPLALNSLNGAQANLFVLALMLLSLTAAAADRWLLAALGAALAGLLLLYPFALAVALLITFPRRFTGPFLIAFALLAAVPFLLQSPAYAAGQYVGWVELLSLRGMGQPSACRDLWHLFRTWHVHLGPGRYELLQLGGGVACLAVLAWYARLGAVARDRLALALLMSVLWVLLLGPATDSTTYALIGPPLVWILLRTGPDRHPVTHHVAHNAYVVLLLCSLAGLHPLATRLLLSAGMQSLAVLYLLIGLAFLAFTWPEAAPAAQPARTAAGPIQRAA